MAAMTGSQAYRHRILFLCSRGNEKKIKFFGTGGKPAADRAREPPCSMRVAPFAPLLAFDGSFFRRIDMLCRDKAFGRATETSPGRTQWMTFGLLGLAAVLAMALRAPLATAADPELSKVCDPAAVPQRDAEVPFDLSRVPAEAVGVVAIRPSSLVGNEAIQSLTTWAQGSDDHKQRFAKAAAIGLSPESIEQVIYFQLKVDLDIALKDDISVLRRGGLIVKTKSAIDAKAARAALKEIGGKYRLSLATLDDRTAIIGDEATITQVSKRAPGVATKYTWSEAWAGVERSQVAIAFDAVYVRGIADPLLMEGGAIELMLLAAPVAPIWQGAKSMSLGLNLVGDEVEILSLNLAGTVQAAETTYETDLALLTLARNAARSAKRQLRKLVFMEKTAWEGYLIAKFADLCASQFLQQTRVVRTGNAVQFTAKVDVDTLLILTQLQ
jgi:hypothetical protein